MIDASLLMGPCLTVGRFLFRSTLLGACLVVDVSLLMGPCLIVGRFLLINSAGGMSSD